MDARALFWSFHLLVSAAAAGALLSGRLPTAGAVWGFVVVYNVGWATLTRTRGHRRLFRQWMFLAALSALQVLPDWFLVEGLGVLSFAEHTPAVGPIPLYMAGFWSFPLVVTTQIGHRARRRFGSFVGRLAVALSALVLFGAAEVLLTDIPLWTAHDVAAVGGAALYILPAEIFLALSVFEILEFRRPRHRATQLLPTVLVMVGYLGAAGLSWLVVERILQISA